MSTYFFANVRFPMTTSSQENEKDVFNFYKKYLLTFLPASFSLSAVLSGLFIFRTAMNTTGNDVVASLQIIKEYPVLNLLIINSGQIAAVIVVSFLSFALPVLACEVLRKFYTKSLEEHKNSSKKVKIFFILGFIVSYLAIDLASLHFYGKLFDPGFSLGGYWYSIAAVFAIQAFISWGYLNEILNGVLSTLLASLLIAGSIYAPLAFISDSSKIPQVCVINYARSSEERNNNPVDKEEYTDMQEGIYLSDSGDAVTLLIRRTISSSHDSSGSPQDINVWSKEKIQLTENKTLIMSSCSASEL